MTDHPMTDEIIDQIQMSHGGPCFECYPDLRSAADWQLEQVIEWLQANLWLHDEDLIIEDLKEAMRPQEDSK